MIDDPTTDDVMTLMEPIALAIGQRYPRRDGIEREDLIGEAWFALRQLAPQYIDRSPDPSGTAMERWFAARIRGHLRSYVRNILLGYLEGVPPNLRRRAVTVHVATERLAARGILRPSYEQIAGEANLDVKVVLMVAACPRVIRRQSAVEWAEDRGGASRDGEPELVPCFGPQPGFSPDRPCNEIVRHPIKKGSNLCCMGCQASGQDHLPALRRNRAKDPRPEPKPTAMPEAERPAETLTRKQRRRLMVWGPQAEAPRAVSA
jgi:hypothetical protein